MRRRFVHQPSSKTTCFSAGGSRSRFPSAGTLASWPTLMLERLQLLNVSRLGMLEIYTETMDSSQITGDLTKVSKVGNVWGKSLIRKYFRKGSSALGKEWLVDNYVSFILMFSSELHLQSYALVSCKLWFWFAIARSWLSIYIYICISIDIKIYINGGWDLNGGKQQEHAKMPQEWELPSLIPGFESYGLEEAHGIPWVFVVFCSICCSTRHVFSSNHLSLVSDWWLSHFVSSRYRCSHSHWCSFRDVFIIYIICGDV